jgi:hypothetical protein
LLLSFFFSSLDTALFILLLFKVLKGERPAADLPTTDLALQNLVALCWAVDPNMRPTFDEIISRLQHHKL